MLSNAAGKYGTIKIQNVKSLDASGNYLAQNGELSQYFKTVDQIQQ
jgi:hypothetical protein